jgi:iron complex transport system substrate-binding protein
MGKSQEQTMKRPPHGIGQRHTSFLDRRQFLAGLAGAGAAAALLPAGSALGQQSVAMRAVEHAHGTVEVPVNPQRTVIFDAESTDLLDLGIPLAGARNLGKEQRCFPEMAEIFEGIFDLGNDDLDLEEVINLQPDLILGSSPGDDDLYDRLVRIAPTLLFYKGNADTNPDHKALWEERFLGNAILLGREQQARDLLAAWDARAEHFKSRLAEKGLQDTTVSLLSINRNTELDLFTRASHPGGVLQKVGLKRPASQDLNGAETWAYSNGGDTEKFDLSFERLNEADADVVIFWGSVTPNPLNDPEAEGRTIASQRSLEVLRKDPIWRTLGAAQRGRVYEVNGLWGGLRSRLAAHRILDDLYRCVLQEEPPAAA